MLQLLNKYFLFSLLIIGLIRVSQIDAQSPASRCLNEYLTRDSSFTVKLNEAEKAIVEYQNTNNSFERTEIIIPVVVHIVWSKIEENISDVLVLSQIEALNRDYNLQNTDISEVPEVFKPLTGNAGIRFCLSAIDPYGNPSTGIERVYTDVSQIGLSKDLYYTAQGGADAWDTRHYLNIWVADMGDIISGFGSYPNQTIPEETGVVVHYKYFGINGHSKYGLGRVATHEVGHFLGLRHLWDDDWDCATDDEVEDTPPQLMAYSKCPIFPQSGCDSLEMFMNFMDYVYDPCMVMFTQGQVTKMLTVMNIFRNDLLQSNQNYSCLISRDSNNILSIYPNPGNGLYICKFVLPPMKLIEVKVFDSLGRLIKYENKVVNDSFEIDFQEVVPGIYFLQTEGTTYKLVKI